MDTSALEANLADHPFLAQLNALKQAFDRVQEELHRNSAKLQSHFHQASSEHERILELELENNLLREEVSALRQTPHPSTLPQSHPAVSQVQQLTLSLRKLSDQLTHTEASLLTRTTELTHARSDLNKAKIQEEKAYELAARIRGREEALSARVQEIEWKVREAQEREKMAEVVIGEYANLVRKLEGREMKNSASNGPLANGNAGGPLEDGLSQGRLGLKRLMSEMEEEISGLQIQLQTLHTEKEELEARVDAQLKAAEADRLAKVQAEFELEKMKVDDNTAAKMVSRYMKFSQSQTNSLQISMATIQTRHSATLSTLHSQIYNLTSQLQASEASLARFQNALEELNGDIMKEAYGRRNEVALRIKMLAREDRMAEGLRRWVKRSDVAYSAISDIDERSEVLTALEEALLDMREQAKTLLGTLETPLALQTEDREVEASASVGRLVVAQYLVEDMKEELKQEVASRLRMGRMVAEAGPEMPEAGEIVERPPVQGGDRTASVAAELQLVSPELLPVLDENMLPSTPAKPATAPPPHSAAVSSSGAQETNGLLSELDSLELDTLDGRRHSIDQSVTTRASPPQKHSPISSDRATSPDGTTRSTDVNTLPTHSTYMASVTPAADVTKEDEDEKNGPSTPTAATTPTFLIPLTPDIRVHEAIESPSILLQASDLQTSVVSPPPPSDIEKPASRVSAPIATPSLNRPPPLPLAMYDRQSSPRSEDAENHLEAEQESEDHPLITRLEETAQRYDAIQRSFRDCHLALQSLRASLSSSYPPPSPRSSSTPIPREVLEAVIERLDDFVEDVRVEIEIRKGDESVLARGFEVILKIPGAVPTSGVFGTMDATRGMPSAGIKSPSAFAGFSSPMQSTLSLLNLASPRTPNAPLPTSTSGMTMQEVEEQIEAFVDGTEPSVRKAVEGFQRKLEDVSHDIARVKMVVFDSETPIMVSTSPSLHPDSASAPEPQPQPIPTPETAPKSASGVLYPSPRHAPSGSGSSSSWTSWLRNASSPLAAPPRPASPAEPMTFGNIMTSPRLRHSPSLTNSLKRSPSATPSDSNDILGSLALRVPMPKFTSNALSKGCGSGKEDAPTKTPAQLSAARARTISTLGMGMLGGVNGLRTASVSGIRLGPAAGASMRSSSSAFSISADAGGIATATQSASSNASPRNSSGAGHRRKASNVERDIDGDTDMEMDSEAEYETETETEGGGSDSDFD